MSTSGRSTVQVAPFGQSDLTLIPPAVPVPPAPAATLEAVVTRLQADPTLSIRRRRDLISAVRILGRMADARLADLPATPAALRQIFAVTSRAAAGLSQERWTNIRSLTLAALRHAGVRTMARRTRGEPLAPEWDDLRLLLPTTKFRHGLSRFMSCCSLEGVLPADVTAATFAWFNQALQEGSLSKTPKQVYRMTCLLWNQAAATIEGWPELVVPVPHEVRRYAMFWEDFPPAFQADAEAFLSRMGNQDPFAEDYAPSVRPSTVALRRKQILQIATALVQSGLPVEQITSLAILVRPEHAKLILRFFLDRRGGKRGSYLHQHAILIKTIARHWVKVPPDQVEALGTFASNLAVKKTGMTEKNRSRLRQFDAPVNVSAVLGLTDDIISRRKKQDESWVGAHRVMLALAVELLLIAPMRIGNLTALEHERHFVRVRTGRASITHIVIPPEETKTGVPLEVELPARTEQLLSLYCATYRPRLAAISGLYLFPNKEGELRNEAAFATTIWRFILRETGIRMNVHLFRHLAVKLHLEAYPEDIETARRILGHKSTATTLRAYADLKTASAFRRYDTLIGTLRKQPAVPARRPRRLKDAS